MSAWTAPGIPLPTCDLCGAERPYDTWCADCDIDAQLDAYRARLDRINGDGAAADRAELDPAVPRPTRPTRPGGPAMSDTLTDLYAKRHPSTVGLLRWFEFSHLPPHLRLVSAKFYNLADDLVACLPDSPELTTALRKLIEAKDCAVRAAIEAQEVKP